MDRRRAISYRNQFWRVVDLEDSVRQFERRVSSIVLEKKTTPTKRTRIPRIIYEPGAPMIHNGIRVTILTVMAKICSRI